MDRSIFIATLIIYCMVNKKKTASEKQQRQSNNNLVGSFSIDGNNKINMDYNKNNQQQQQQQQNIINNNSSTVDHDHHPEIIKGKIISTAIIAKDPSTTNRSLTTTPTTTTNPSIKTNPLSLLAVENNNTSSPTTHQSMTIMDENNNNVKDHDDEESINNNNNNTNNNNNDIMSMISSTPKREQLHMISSLSNNINNNPLLRTPPLSSFDTTPRQSNIILSSLDATPRQSNIRHNNNNSTIISFQNSLVENNNNNNNSTLFIPSISANNNNTTNSINSNLVHSDIDNSMGETKPTTAAAVMSTTSGSKTNTNLLTYNNNNSSNTNTNTNNSLVSKTTTTSPYNPNSPYHQRYSPGTYNNKRSVILNPHVSPGMMMNQNQQQRVAATATNNNTIRQLPMIPNIGNNTGNNLNSSSNHNRNDINNRNSILLIIPNPVQSSTATTTKTNTLNESINTTTNSIISSSQTNNNRSKNNMNEQLQLLLPIHKCPLLCCFYAEFDNIVGPKILYESPNGFMEQDIHISIPNVESILNKTFQELLLSNINNNDDANNTNSNSTNNNDSNDSNSTNNDSSKTKSTQQLNDTTSVLVQNDDTRHSNDDSKTNDTSHISQGDVSTITPNTFIPADSVPERGSGIRSISMNTNSSITQETITTKTPRSSSNHKRISSSSSSNRGIIENEASSPIPPIVVVEDPSTFSIQPVSSNTGKQQDTPVTWSRSHKRIPSSGSRGGGGGGGGSSFNFDSNNINNLNTTTTTSQQQLNSSNLKKERNTNNASNVHDSFTDFSVKSMYSSITNNNNDHDSIFDSCSEYIITGTELSGTIVNLSTHNLHIITRPTSISDVKYERNCLSFCFGFIARRTVDPRPFRTVLSKLALLIQTMEIEHQYITKSKLYYPPSSQTINNSYVGGTYNNNNGKEGSSFDMTIQPNIQDLLENILLSLNSIQGECNIIFQNHKGHHSSSHLLSVGSSSCYYYYPDSIGNNVLNLKLFLPPRIPATPVKEYEVPILLRRDWQSYDWDLAINWVSFHIDGIMNARQISQKAEVDLEMVLACLRVLRHHGVVAIVDMFFYTNRYECTDRVSSLLLYGTTRCDESNDKNDNKVSLLQQAVAYTVIDKERDTKEQQQQQASPLLTSLGGGIDSGPMSVSPNHHNYGSPSNFLYHPNRVDFGGLGIRSHSGGSSSYKPFASGSFRFAASSFQQQSYHHTLRDVPKAIPLPQKRNDYNEIAVALTELYCSCHRGISFGDLLLSLVSSSTSKNNVHKNQNLLHPFSTDRCIDWEKIWSLIDHRRFIIFGIVNGLLKRVHNYPLIIDENHDADDKEPINKDDDVLSSPTRKINRDYDSFTSSPSAILGDNSFNKSNRSSVSFSRLKKKKSLRYGGSIEHTEEENRKMLQSNIASMMNGLHCDDELVSNFNMPLTNLFDLVAPKKGSIEGQQQSTKKRIVSVYSVANDEDTI